MGNQPRVTVLGSLNMDISVTVPRLPEPGATVLGSAARFTPGGKGANQAVAAARLGADVRLAGCVGDDDFGRRLLAALRAEGVNAEAVRVAAQAPTGLAMISLDQAGENLITVAPGANDEVGAKEVTAAAGHWDGVLVVCAEIPVAAIRLALTRGGPHILNLAPAPAEAAEIVAGGVDWLVVNESEAAAVLSANVRGLDDATRAARELAARGARHAVVTAGAHGAALAGPGTAQVIEAFGVDAVDTVGAGDAFVGALAVAVAAGVPAADAVRAAAAAGAAAATRHGAQAGMPRPADILAVTGLTWPVHR
ncbi:MAG: bifunctional hydroxymethylpyrimidine kinase/phosphomethylpyrimidine kinase [Actinobacteria bacterium]|nr:bifunctional hydroxymethylpyrimidine kinase/phosphomethylpyrimidine kinase [Actinomycetota bacterium]